MIYNNIISEPEMSKEELVKKLEAYLGKKLPQIFIDAIGMYYVISPKRGGVNPVIAILDFISNSRKNDPSISGTSDNIETRNPGNIMLKDQSYNCETWVEGITLHVDRIASAYGATGYPRKDTPDILNTEIHNKGLSVVFTSLTDDFVSGVLGNEIDLPESDIAILNKLKEMSILSDVAYWENVLKGVTKASPDFIRQVFQNVIDKK